MKRIITSPDAPEALGPYSQATTEGNLVFTSGQIARTPDGDVLADESIEVQTRQCLENIKSILEEEGLTLQNVLKVSVFLTNIQEFDTMNAAYGEYFTDNPPARSAFEVNNLPGGVAIEIEAVAGKN